MKQKRIALIVVTMILVITGILGQFVSNADGGISVNRRQYNSQGGSYALNNNSNVEIFWNLYETSDANKTLYCVKAGYGQRWSQTGSAGFEPVNYTLSYDMKPSKIENGGKVLDQTKVEELKNALGLCDSDNSIKENYNSIVWILENMYVPKSFTSETEKNTAKMALLNAAKIMYGKDPNGDEDDPKNHDLYYYDTTAVSGAYAFVLKQNTTRVVDTVNNKYMSVVLSDEDIEAVQQAAIWYFTNRNSGGYDKKSDNYWLNYKLGTANKEVDSTTPREGYSSITNLRTERIDITNTNYGDIINTQANLLYRYLINSAEEVKDDDIYLSGLVQNEPSVVVDTTNGVRLDDGGTYYIAPVQKSGEDYYAIGPIKIQKNGNANIDSIVLEEEGYGINTEITNCKVAETLTGSQQAYSEEIIKDDYIKYNKSFYIFIPKESVFGLISFRLSYNYQKTTETLWLEGTKEEQPLVEVSKTPANESILITSVIPQEKIIDLALRKVITGVKRGNETISIVNKNGDNAIRNMTVDASTLRNSDTTATYRHRKDPVLVKEGDIIEYKLKIYNEGESKGFASQIIDQLPAGMIWVDSNKDTENEGKIISDIKQYKYKVTWNTEKNQIILAIDDNDLAGIIPLNEFNKNDKVLDYDEITIYCKIPNTVSENTIFTNIAYISEACNCETETKYTKYTIANVDIDSAPGIFPRRNNLVPPPRDSCPKEPAWNRRACTSRRLTRGSRGWRRPVCWRWHSAQDPDP